jgi:predicted branched-subunit amino acid permease
MHAIEDLTTFERFAHWLRAPFPVRARTEHRFQWLVDAFVAFVLWIVGTIVAGFFSQALPSLEALAYPTGLFIGWFPIEMWMRYCRMSRETGIAAVLLSAGLLTFFAVFAGWRGVSVLPSAFAILLLLLPVEWMIAKLIFGWRLSSRSGQQTEPRSRSTH